MMETTGRFLSFPATAKLIGLGFNSYWGRFYENEGVENLEEPSFTFTNPLSHVDLP
jgi:hypothetical protein